MKAVILVLLSAVTLAWSSDNFKVTRVMIASDYDSSPDLVYHAPSTEKAISLVQFDQMFFEEEAFIGEAKFRIIGDNKVNATDLGKYVWSILYKNVNLKAPFPCGYVLDVEELQVTEEENQYSVYAYGDGGRNTCIPGSGGPGYFSFRVDLSYDASKKTGKLYIESGAE